MSDTRREAEWTILTLESFGSALRQSSKPLLVDFWAEWCAPCVTYEPIVDEVVAEFKGQLVAGRVDVGSEPELAEQCGISSVPALALYRDGVVVRRIFGARNSRFLREELRSLLE